MIARLSLMLCAALTSLCLGLRAQAAAGPGTYAADLATIELANLTGVTATLKRIAADQGGPAARVTFEKETPERRFVALELQPQPPLTACRSLDVRYQLTADPSLTVRFAFLAYERGGGAWFRSGTPLPPTPTAHALHFSVQALRQTAFSQDASGQLEWDQVERVWLGFLVDGQGKGSFELTGILLTSAATKATEPLAIFRADPAQWSVGADPAVTGKETQAVEIDGQKCLKFTFHFPGGRHMYYVPTQSVEELEFSAYAGLRFTYRATVPAGLDGLLVCVHENGGQFVATPPPAASGDWESVTVPWSAFPLGAWSKDDNGRLDVDAINQVSVGAHGTATGAGGDGEILLRAIELVPATK